LRPCARLAGMNVLPTDIAELFARYGGVIDTATARRAGLSEARLRHAARAGKIYRLGPGIYVRADPAELGAWDQFMLRGRAFAMAHSPSALVTGWAATKHWRLPTLGRPPALPSAVRPVGSGGPFTSARGRMTEATIPHAHRARLGAVGIASRAWATLDLSRTAPLPHSLVVADQALRAGLDLAAVLHHMRGWRGIARARWVVEHADPCAETPLETLGRFTFIEYELPMPVANAWVGHDRPRKRLDGLLPWHWWGWEGDGGVKYDNRSDASRIVRDQVDREFYLRELGLGIVRYTWADVHPSRAPFAAKARSMFARYPRRDKPVRWWKHVPGGDPVDPEPDDLPSPQPMRILLPAGWDVATANS
jgi:hypothetical protein